MQLNRREFTAGAAALGASGALASRATARVGGALSPTARAVAAIHDYAEAHLKWFGLPGITVGVTSPNGFATVIDVGFANRDSSAPITAGTLFQIGSISKSFAAALLHQYAAEGRLKLSDRLVTALPGAPLPADSPVEVQHVLDHVAGLPGDSPPFVQGGLWTAYAPGAHWHYSNTGYALLGHLAERLGGKPLDRLLEERLFRPLGMTRTRGAILSADRMLYAQGYQPFDLTVTSVRGLPLAPAAWVDVTDAAGSIASTAADMFKYLRSLAGAVQGRGGMGLNPAAALAYATHAVPSDSDEMAYGNGLMHVEIGGREYLHHTGGMVSFSSAFHVDTASGHGAFASSNISAFEGYRPRSLTAFAAQALLAAETGQPIPDPPALDRPVKSPADYAGLYRSAGRSLEIRSGAALTIRSGSHEAPLEQAGRDLFATSHPGFRDFLVQFGRDNDAVLSAAWGPETFVREGATVTVPPSDPKLALLAGRYVNDSPWVGSARVVERGGKLWLGTESPLVPIGDNLWRAGEEDWSPERVSFLDYLNGRPQTFSYSGEKFARQDS